MQRVLFNLPDLDQIQSQVNQVLPGHVTEVQGQAVNDDIYKDENSPLWQVCSVLGNVIGGVLLLSALFTLPHVLAGFLG